MNTRRDVLSVLGLAAALAVPGPLAIAARRTRTPSWLAGLDGWLEAQRAAWQVPGLAVALIKDGVPAYQQVFGVRSVLTGEPVTGQTLFRGASTTKAVTAAVLARLVESGMLDWDRPVGTWLPGFRTAGGAAYDSISLRDMLCHRTGLPRHDLVWYGQDGMTHADVLARLPFLPPRAPLRAAYQYNNIMVILAAHAAEVASGRTYSELAAAHITGPLAMARTHFSVPDMAADRDHAVGHTWSGSDAPTVMPLRNDTALGPAGGINTTIGDYARWAQMLLGNGSLAGRQVLLPASLATLWEPQVLTGRTPARPDFSPAGYGLGWRLDRYRGMPRVAHGGDNNGFTSRVVLLPEQGIGLVLLCNMGSSPLVNAIVPDLIDRMTGTPLPPGEQGSAVAALARREASVTRAAVSPSTEPGRVDGTSPSRALDRFQGRYGNPGYGTFEVEAGPDGLAARLGTVPGALDHVHYDVFAFRNLRPEHGDFRGLRLAFQSDDAGAISGLTVRMEDDVPPLTFARAG
jgi:CubicO group peptidase (beta-lactamase class C family)